MPVEFGVELDLSIDESGYGRTERISFDAYNECGSLENVAERYKERFGHYPMRILADQSYWTRDNCRFCKERGFACPGRSWVGPAGQQSRTKRQNIRTM